jgi:hypothetical protein
MSSKNHYLNLSSSWATNSKVGLALFSFQLKTLITAKVPGNGNGQ